MESVCPPSFSFVQTPIQTAAAAAAARDGTPPYHVPGTWYHTRNFQRIDEIALLMQHERKNIETSATATNSSHHDEIIRRLRRRRTRGKILRVTKERSSRPMRFDGKRAGFRDSRVESYECQAIVPLDLTAVPHAEFLGKQH